MIHVVVPTCLADPTVIGAFLHSLNGTDNLDEQDGRIYFIVNDEGPASCVRDLLDVVDGSLDYRVYVEGSRVGFVDACNMGYRIAEPADNDILIVLNDDLVFRGRWLDRIVGAIRKGAAQVGPSMKHVGRDAMWGRGDERYRYLEGWCFATTGAVVRRAAREIRMLNAPKDWPRGPVLFDPQFSPAYCEDMDFSIRVQESGGEVVQVDLPIQHLHSQTYGRERPSWAPNRQKLIEKWDLG